jgi:hypothetical protein
MAAYPPEPTAAGRGPAPVARRAIDAERAVNAIEADWNAFRSGFSGGPAVDDAALAAVLAEAIGAAGRELSPARAIACRAEGRFVSVDDAGARRVVGVCNKAPQGGALARQVDELKARAEGIGAVAVALRSTSFPSNRRTGVFRTLEDFAQAGGRRLTVEDADWRTMAAFARFRARCEGDPAFDSWRRRTRPLTGLESLRTILDLDRPAPEARAETG